MKKQVKFKGKKDKAVPKHFWGAVIGAGVSLLSNAMAKKSTEEEQRKATALENNMVLSQASEQDRLEKEEFEDSEGYNIDGYYRKRGGKISKYNNGGGTDPNKKLNKEQVDEINESTGVQFNEEGANRLFTTRDEVNAPSVDDLDLGIYKDYFSVDHDGEKYVVSNTEKNPHNADTVKRLYPYIQNKNKGKNLNMKFDYKALGGDLKKKVVM